MATDQRKNRDKKVSDRTIPIRPVNDDVWDLLEVYRRIFLNKNRITKAEYLESLIIQDLSNKKEEIERVLSKKWTEIINKYNKNSKKNKQD